MDSSDPLYVFGPAGSGKTSLIKQLAAKLNYPVFDITGHGRLEFPDMVGHLTVEDSNMTFQYGPLALAMKFGGLFLLNEIDLLDPATAAGLNGILDGDPLRLPTPMAEPTKPDCIKERSDRT
jgi:cobaltochelatase CobS